MFRVKQLHQLVIHNIRFTKDCLGSAVFVKCHQFHTTQWIVMKEKVGLSYVFSVFLTGAFSFWQVVRWESSQWKNLSWRWRQMSASWPSSAVVPTSTPLVLTLNWSLTRSTQSGCGHSDWSAEHLILVSWTLILTSTGGDCAKQHCGRITSWWKSRNWKRSERELCVFWTSCNVQK